MICVTTDQLTALYSLYIFIQIAFALGYICQPLINYILQLIANESSTPWLSIGTQRHSITGLFS